MIGAGFHVFVGGLYCGFIFGELPATMEGLPLAEVKDNIAWFEKEEELV